MPETMNTEIAVMHVCTAYGLDAAEFSRLLALLGSITPEQKNRVVMLSAAWAARDVMENSLGVTS